MNWRSSPTSWLVGAIFLLAIVPTVTGKVIYVDADANGLNDGSSWADAYNYLRDALADANTAAKPVEIRVAEGIYKPDQGVGITPGDRTATFRLINGVAIKGGYAGFGEPEPNARDIELYETILGGDLASNDVDVDNPYYLLDDPCRSDNSYHVVTGSGTDANAVLGGFTICSGKAGGSYPENLGGGLYNYEGDPTVINCTFSANSDVAMFNHRSAPTVIGCMFRGNASSVFAGGIWNKESDSTINDCVFEKNFGTGMENDYSNTTVTNCTFNSNLGGGIFNGQSNTIVSLSLFSGNTGDRFGGGIFNHGSSATISNCTFSGNRAGLGGGIYNLSGTLLLTNNILWGNIPNQISGFIGTITYSDIQAGLSGEGNIDRDPCFAVQGYWDDPCNTPGDKWDDIWIEGDYHLKSQGGRWEPSTKMWVHDKVTSSCIDAANPMSPIGLEPFPNGGWVNMGAFGGTTEASKSYFGQPVCEIIVAGDVNGDCKVNFLDFRIMALNWLEDNTPPDSPPPPPG